MNTVSLSFLELIFGLSSLLGFALAVYVYFKSKAEIYTLIERLRASRANFIQIEAQVDRIIMISETKDKTPEEKLR